MVERAEFMVEAPFRLLGRFWNRVLWTALLLVAVLWDVSALFGYQSLDVVSGFVAGLATGIVVAGFIVTFARERAPTPAQHGTGPKRR